jgi:hypothetical protein
VRILAVVAEALSAQAGEPLANLKKAAIKTAAKRQIRRDRLVTEHPANRVSNPIGAGSQESAPLLVRPAGRTLLEVKVLYIPDTGKC